jgi:hypothetical protein
MLDVTTRGLLERTIDEAKAVIPGALMKARETTKEMHIQNSEDYTLGLAIGYIIGKFAAFFAMLYRRSTDEQELKEVREVIFNRTAELRETIFKTG